MFHRGMASKEQKPSKYPIVIELESYLALRGAHKSFGDPALHRSHVRHSKNTWQRLVDRQATKDLRLAERREYLRREFAELVAVGILRVTHTHRASDAYGPRSLRQCIRPSRPPPVDQAWYRVAVGSPICIQLLR